MATPKRFQIHRIYTEIQSIRSPTASKNSKLYILSRHTFHCISSNKTLQKQYRKKGNEEKHYKPSQWLIWLVYNLIAQLLVSRNQKEQCDTRNELKNNTGIFRTDTDHYFLAISAEWYPCFSLLRINKPKSYKVTAYECKRNIYWK